VQRQQRKSNVMTSFGLTACSAAYYQVPHWSTSWCHHHWCLWDNILVEVKFLEFPWSAKDPWRVEVHSKFPLWFCMMNVVRTLNACDNTCMLTHSPQTTSFCPCICAFSERLRCGYSQNIFEEKLFIFWVIYFDRVTRLEISGIASQFVT
jgi:hypothetical protein